MTMTSCKVSLLLFKTDYGSLYDGVRVAKGYGIKGRQGVGQGSTVKKDIYYILSRIGEYSMANCNEAIGFFDQLYSKEWDVVIEKRRRAFVALLAVFNRVNVHRSKSRSGMTASLSNAVQLATSRCKALIHKVCDNWPREQDLRSTLVGAHVTLRDVAAWAIGVRTGADLAQFDSASLLDKFRQI